MKYVKCISLFIVYPLLVLGLGFYAGVRSSHYFYPERESREEQEDFLRRPWMRERRADKLRS